MLTREKALRASSPALAELGLWLVGVATNATLAGLEAISRRRHPHLTDRGIRFCNWLRM